MKEENTKRDAASERLEIDKPSTSALKAGKEPLRDDSFWNDLWKSWKRFLE
jgi:hypothetical protein